MKPTVWAVAGLLGFVMAAAVLVGVIISYNNLKGQVEKQTLALAQSSAQASVLTDLTVTINQTTGDLRSAFDLMCGSQDTERSASDLSRCSLLSSSINPDYLFFLTEYSKSAVARATAASADDFEALAAGYVKLLPLAERFRNPENQNIWKSVIHEGMAYAQLRHAMADAGHRQDDLRAASENIAKAKAFDRDGRSAWVGLTALKIACSGSAPPPADDISKEYRQLYAVLRRHREDARSRYSGNAENPVVRSTSLEVSYFENDREVRIICGYADLPDPEDRHADVPAR